MWIISHTAINNIKYITITKCWFTYHPKPPCITPMRKPCCYLLQKLELSKGGQNKQFSNFDFANCIASVSSNWQVCLSLLIYAVEGFQDTKFLCCLGFSFQRQNGVLEGSGIALKDQGIWPNTSWILASTCSVGPRKSFYVSEPHMENKNLKFNP